ncbi:hypothetical protein, partial [Klebsiella pneumoniae]|uniref:hypothetical protein n=1 Tax=Klebsiella pneumoniae TaxID=573 RepID=UPI001C52BB92
PQNHTKNKNNPPSPPNHQPKHNPPRKQHQIKNLTKTIHLSNNNTNILKQTQKKQKPPIKQKNKNSLNLNFQYKYKPQKQNLTILPTFKILNKKYQKNYHKNN